MFNLAPELPGVSIADGVNRRYDLGQHLIRGSLGPEMYGRLAFCDYVRMVRSALESYRCHILECVTEGHRAFAKIRFSGTHVAPFRGHMSTGKTVHWLGAALFSVERQRIADLWVLGDLVSLDALLKESSRACEKTTNPADQLDAKRS